MFYIADFSGHAVRRVAAGLMTTYAGTLGTSGFIGNGGAATSALLSAPRGLGLDGNLNLYIAGTACAKLMGLFQVGFLFGMPFMLAHFLM